MNLNPTLSNKMNHFETSIFSELANYKKKKMQEGFEMIDLSVGSPDSAPPKAVMDELSKNVQDPTQYGYALSGIDELHQAISSYYNHNYHVRVNSEKEVLTVMGSQDGLVHLPLVLTNPNDVVLVPDPGYTAYDAGISLAGAKPFPMPLKEENQFLPDLEAIPDDMKQKAKLMILNFPGNPVPALATKEFFREVVQFAKQYNIVVLHDFAYSELYYEEKPISFLSIDGAKEVGIEFNSFSKSFNMAGCRVGYVLGNAFIIDGLNRLKSNLDYGIFIPIQKAAVRALEDSGEFTTNLRNMYKTRRDILIEGLNNLGWKVEAPAATMFIWAKIPKEYTSTDFTYRLMDDAGIVVVPGNAFGTEGEGYVRISLCQNEENLRKAIQNLKQSNIFSTMIS